MPEIGKKGGGAVALFLVLLVAAGFYLAYGGSTQSLAPLSLAIPSTGTTLQACSHMLTQGINQQNFSGTYWFCTVFVNGGSQQLTGFTGITSQQLAQSLGGNLTGTSNPVAFNVHVNKNQIIVPAQTGSGFSYSLFTYYLSVFSGQFSYRGCNNNNITVSGGQLGTGTLGCIIGSPQAITNFVNACKQKVGNTANATGLAIQGSSGFSQGLYCYVLQKRQWAGIYQLGQPQQNQSVTVQANGASLTVNTSKTYAAHQTNGKVDLAVQLFPTANGNLYIGGPQDQNIGVLFIPYNTSGAYKAPALLSYSSFTNLQNVAYNIQANITGISGCTGYFGYFATLYGCSTGAYSPSGPYNLTQVLQSQNNALGQRLALQTPGNTSWTISGLSVYLNDPNFQWITPQTQIVTSLQLVGISLASCSPQIVAYTNPRIRSGTNGYATMTVKNNGNVAASCTATIGNYSGAFNPVSQLQQMIQPGASYTFNFSLTLSNPIPPGSTGYSQAFTYTSCDLVTGTNCASQNAIASLLPACNTGPIVNGQCQVPTTITIPTTTIPKPGANSTTTIAVNQTCTPPAQFNQSYYNRGIIPPCWIPNPGISPWLIIGGIVVAIAAAFLLGGRNRFGGAARPVGRGVRIG